MKKNIYSNLFTVIAYICKLNFGFKYNYKLYNIVVTHFLMDIEFQIKKMNEIDIKIEHF